MKGIDTWKLVEKNLSQGIRVMLLYVVESQGSSPGRQGFFMAVSGGDPVISGSIGGGIMEHKFVEMAKDRLKLQEFRIEIKKQFHNKIATTGQSGMICSGEQTIVLYSMEEKDLAAVQAIISSLENAGNGTLILSPGGIGFVNQVPEKDFDYSFRSEGDWIYREKTGFRHHLHIVGGGHCALALSRLMQNLDFYIHVYDDRKDLNTVQYNEAAQQKVLVNDYQEIGQLIPPGHQQYVVIMTMGYRTDDIVIRSLMQKEFRFMGILGSRSKIEKMMNEYRKEGFSDSLLKRLHAPVGVMINSQTPEEIAVSIAAALIDAKNSPDNV